MRNRSNAFFLVVILTLFGQMIAADSEIILNPANGHTYQRIDALFSWHEAKSYCERLGGYLATMTSWDEDVFISSNLVNTTASWIKYCWLGGTDEEREGTWKWITGEPWGYTHWLPGQPDNCCGGEHYLHCCTPWSDAKPNFWNDLPDAIYKFPLICEWGNQLTVTCPNGGEVWLYGSIHTIKWDKTGTLSTVKIEYTLNGGTNWITIAESAPNTGSYTWTVPSSRSSNCLIRITAPCGKPSDVSDRPFSICPNSPNWVPIEHMQYNMSIYGKAYNRTNLASPGDYIGAFGPGDLSDCRGVGTIDSDGSYFLTVRSNATSSECESITFKLWPLPSGPSIDSSETVRFIPEETYSGFSLHFGIRTQCIPLVCGWNWVSFNAMPSNTSLNSFFGDLLGTIEQIRSQNQSAIYSNGNWIGDLKDMNGINNGMMYKIKAKKASTLTVNGAIIPFNKPLPVCAGWNWVAYLPTLCQPMERALKTIIDKVLQVKSQNQAAVKIGGKLIGDLTQMEPNKGYTILMNTDCVLVYPQGISMPSPKKSSVNARRLPYVLIQGNQYNMTAVGKVLLDGEVLRKSGYDVVGLGPGGDADCRSISPVGTNGSYFATILGDKSGEIITFKLYKRSNKHTYDMSKTLIFQPDSIKKDYDLNFRRGFGEN
ncbi:MAG: lectin-like protein [Candidatus Omnitrophota bacterium]